MVIMTKSGRTVDRINVLVYYLASTLRHIRMRTVFDVTEDVMQ